MSAWVARGGVEEGGGGGGGGGRGGRGDVVAHSRSSSRRLSRIAEPLPAAPSAYRLLVGGARLGPEET